MHSTRVQRARCHGAVLNRKDSVTVHRARFQAEVEGDV